MDPVRNLVDAEILYGPVFLAVVGGQPVDSQVSRRFLAAADDFRDRLPHVLQRACGQEDAVADGTLDRLCERDLYSPRAAAISRPRRTAAGSSTMVQRSRSG